MPQDPSERDNSIESVGSNIAAESTDPLRFVRPVGKVYLVGAGPGDPGLITVRGVECLQRADAVLYDYLANPRLLEYAKADAERICLGKHGRSRIWPQTEINQWLVDKARSGSQVVRLKGGDPAVFARGAEEIEALAQNGIPFEVVPGITAALAASSYAGIPVTHREWASAVALVTGHEDESKSNSDIDYANLARFQGTLVFYMGVTTVGIWSSELIRAGMDPQTPVAVIRHCSLPDQKVTVCTLQSVEQAVQRPDRLRPPVLFVVGKVVTLAPLLSWFDRRPLFGKRILVTRAADQSQELVSLLEEAGAQVDRQPAIEIAAPDDWGPVDEALDRLSQFDWVVFSSTNGVRYFLNRLLATGRDIRSFGNARLATVGPGTAAAMAQFSLRSDLVPVDHQAEGLLLDLQPQSKGKQILLVRASRGREILAESLTQCGARVTQVVAYSSRDVLVPDPAVKERLQAGQIDAVIVTSSAIARSVVAMFGDSLRTSRLLSISPLTSATLAELGYRVDAESPAANIPALFDAVLSVCGKSWGSKNNPSGVSLVPPMTKNGDRS